MCLGTTAFLLNQVPDNKFLSFVFFATLCSYNLHWYLSTNSQNNGERILWSQQNRHLQFFLFLIGLIGSIFFGLFLLKFWLWLGFAAFITLLYTSPKMPYANLILLKKIAFGKTIYLALVWVYVTCILPIVINASTWDSDFIWFILSRLCLIYANCILFDLRDKEADINEGIRSLITYLSDKNIMKLFISSVLLFLIFGLMTIVATDWVYTATLLFPGVLLAASYRYFRQNLSDFTYYFLLDGLLILSSVLLLVLKLWY